MYDDNDDRGGRCDRVKFKCSAETVTTNDSVFSDQLTALRDVSLGLPYRSPLFSLIVAVFVSSINCVSFFVRLGMANQCGQKQVTTKRMFDQNDSPLRRISHVTVLSLFSLTVYACRGVALVHDGIALLSVICCVFRAHHLKSLASIGSPSGYTKIVCPLVLRKLRTYDFFFSNDA